MINFYKYIKIKYIQYLECMTLNYKSCIFCDVIFDISKPHICVDVTPSVSIEIPHTDSFQKIDENKPTTTNEYQNNMIISLPKPKKQVIIDSSNDDDIPSQKDLYKLILQLTKKCEGLQNEINNLKSQQSRKLKRDIAEYLQYDQRPRYTFLEWVRSFVISDEILDLVFDSDLFEGIKKCIEDRLHNEGDFSIPIRMFKEKPDWFFIFTNEPIVKSRDNQDDGKDDSKDDGKIRCSPVEIVLGVNTKDLLQTPTWRMVSKNDFMRVKEYISEHILKKFYIWEADNEPKMRHSSEKMDILTNYTLKVIGYGSKYKKDRQNSELFRWFFSKIAV